MVHRGLLVGAGGMGKGWARNLANNEKVELAGWIDVREGAAGAAAVEQGVTVPFTGSNLTNALAAVNPDFVIDVTPPEVHHDVTLQALAFGVPVIGEKPMAATMEQARAMVRASEQAGKLYMVSQSRRYNNRARSFGELIQAHLGGLGILNSDFYIGAHFGGFRDEMDHVLILDMAIHTFDMARMLSGKNAVAVTAQEFNPDWSWYKGPASAQCWFEMEGGLMYNYRGSWCAEGLHTSWEGDWRAVGENGTALWDGTGDSHTEVLKASAGFHSEMSAVASQPMVGKEGIEGSLEDFLRALETGSTPQGECHDNIQSLAMVCAAVESAIRGQRVEVSEVLQG